MNFITKESKIYFLASIGFMKNLFTFFAFLLVSLLIPCVASAVYEPATRPNNKFGIHILFPAELEKAKLLVNSNGGDWGYVTIPIQAGDRDLEKWQDFMTNAAKMHLVPIIRIATEAFWANTGVWRKPTDYDILDFANFLNSLTWPTKNRYVLLFNEVNRYDEWGGEAPSPEEYADFVEYAVDTFKTRSQNFYIIAGGLDNASPNDQVKYFDNLYFLRRMGLYNPKVFEKIDGFSSHSYPNPNFAQAPSQFLTESTSTYKHEIAIVDEFTDKPTPVFITETGWNADALKVETVASYFKTAMIDIWGQDSRVIAVTPFILESSGGPFDKFTFYKGEGLTFYGKTYQNLKKTRGEPILNDIPKIAKNVDLQESKLKFDSKKLVDVKLSSNVLKSYIKSLLSMGI